MRKIPIWVGYAMTPAEASTDNADRKDMRFRPDPDCPRDNVRSLWTISKQRGTSTTKITWRPPQISLGATAAMKATFVLSNAVPQKHGVNGVLWSRPVSPGLPRNTARSGCSATHRDLRPGCASHSRFALPCHQDRKANCIPTRKVASTLWPVQVRVTIFSLIATEYVAPRLLDNCSKWPIGYLAP